MTGQRASLRAVRTRSPSVTVRRADRGCQPTPPVNQPTESSKRVWLGGPNPTPTVRLAPPRWETNRERGGDGLSDVAMEPATRPGDTPRRRPRDGPAALSAFPTRKPRFPPHPRRPHIAHPLPKRQAAAGVHLAAAWSLAFSRTVNPCVGVFSRENKALPVHNSPRTRKRRARRKRVGSSRATACFQGVCERCARRGVEK